MIKHLLILFTIILTSSMNAQALRGVIKVGNAETYTNLTQAFADIKLKSVQDTLYLELSGSYDFSTETLPIIFPKFTFASEYDRVIIRPSWETPLLIMQANIDTAMFIFDNSVQTIFEGRKEGDWQSNITVRNISTKGSAFLVINSSYDSEISKINVENSGKYSVIVNNNINALYKVFKIQDCSFSDRKDIITNDLPEVHIYSVGSNLDLCRLSISFNDFSNFKYSAINIDHYTLNKLLINYNSIYFNHPTFKLNEAQTAIKVNQSFGNHLDVSITFNWIGGSGYRGEGNPYTIQAPFTGIQVNSKDDLFSVTHNVITNISVVDTVNPSLIPFRGMYLSTGIWASYNYVGRDFIDSSAIKVLTKINNASVYGLQFFNDAFANSNRRDIVSNQIRNISTNADNIYGIFTPTSTEVSSNVIGELGYLENETYLPASQNYYGMVTNAPEDWLSNNMIYLGKGIKTDFPVNITLLKVNGYANPLYLNNNNFYLDGSNNAPEKLVFVEKSSWSGETNIYNNIFANRRVSTSSPRIISKLSSDLNGSLNSFKFSHNALFLKSMDSLFIGNNDELYSFGQHKDASNLLNYFNYADVSYLFTKTNIGTLYVEGTNEMTAYINNLGRPITNFYYDWYQLNLRSNTPVDGMIDIGAQEFEFKSAYFGEDYNLTADSCEQYFSNRMYSKIKWNNSERPSRLSSYIIQNKLVDSSNYTNHKIIFISEPKEGLSYDLTMYYDPFAMAGIFESKLRPAVQDELDLIIFNNEGTGIGQYTLDTVNNSITIHGLDRVYSVFTIVEDKEVLSVNDKGTVNTYSLSQNYPNPFNPETKINFSLAEKTNVKVEVYNVNGELIKSLFAGELNSGQHSVNFEGRGLASGTYIYRITTPKYTESKKMILVK